MAVIVVARTSDNMIEIVLSVQYFGINGIHLSHGHRDQICMAAIRYVRLPKSSLPIAPIFASGRMPEAPHSMSLGIVVNVFRARCPGD
jgi:hypothetical protein